MVLCFVRNSCRSRISTREGACLSWSCNPIPCSSSRSSCQFRSNAAHSEQCNSAHVRLAASPIAPFVERCQLEFFARHDIFLRNCLPAGDGAFRRFPQNLQFRKQQSSSPVNPRANCADRTIEHTRCIFVAHLFEQTEHHRFAKLGWQLHHRGTYPLTAFAHSAECAGVIRSIV